MLSLGKRHTFHLPLSVIFFCSLYCMFENCYKYVLSKSHLICTGTAEDQLKPAYEKGCSHEYAHAAVVTVTHPAGNQSQSSILLSYPKENNGNNETHLYSVLWTNHRAALEITPSYNSQQKSVLQFSCGSAPFIYFYLWIRFCKGKEIYTTQYFIANYFIHLKEYIIVHKK